MNRENRGMTAKNNPLMALNNECSNWNIFISSLYPSYFNDVTENI